jgi:hypothetical protein
MSWTKGDIVRQAYEELAIAGYVYDLTDDELLAGLRRLDTMMATWASQGLRVSYTANAAPDGSQLTDASGLPLAAVEAVYLGLAVRLAASKGKQLAASTKTTAKAAFDALLARQAAEDVREQQTRSGVPAGAGNKSLGTLRPHPYLTNPDTDPLRISSGGGLDLTNLGG